MLIILYLQNKTIKVRHITTLIYERTSRVIGLNVVYLLMFNSDSTKHVVERERGGGSTYNSERGIP